MTRVNVRADRMREICEQCIDGAKENFIRRQREAITEWRSRWFNRLVARLFGEPSDERVIDELRGEWRFDVVSPPLVIERARDILAVLEDERVTGIDIEVRELAILKSWCK